MALPVFPTLPGIGYPITRTPVHKTEIEETYSGKDTGFRVWAYPRRRYELVANVLRMDAVRLEWQQLIGFFNRVGGRAGTFLFDDAKDDLVSDQAFGAGNGSAKSFQLVRSLGGFTQPVFAPNVIVNIKINGTATAAYTVGNGGVITFTTAPANGAALTWSGSYYWICRFDDDELPIQQFMADLHAAESIKFTTVKV